MIDSTKSPTPAWKRYGTIVLLAVLVVAAAYTIWTKELHKGASSTSAGAKIPVAATPARTAAPRTSTTSTTVPGGIPLSNRNPFTP